MSYDNPNPADNSVGIKIIQRCMHCGEEVARNIKYCPHCSTADQRREMCRENQIINPKHLCTLCKVLPT